MKSGLTSIIVATYDIHPLLRRITSTCLHNIEKYTNRDEYELILVDNKENGERLCDLDERYHRFKIDHHIINEQDKGYSASCNQGAEVAQGEFLSFIQNDVFVWECWLSQLREYLERNICDVIYPHQGPTSREMIKEAQNISLEMAQGNNDAGLTMMRKKDFDKIGGWDERFKGVLQEVAFRRKFSKANLIPFCTSKVIITHIGASVRLVQPIGRFEKMNQEETKFYHEN